MSEGKRTDLREKTIFTIDGADAKDLDDAVSIEKTETGNYLLGVHIADVSHYVAEGSETDIEALFRGTSIYPPGQVIHMLPEELANGVCSLNKGEDRLTLSVFMEITPGGEVAEHRINESVICSRERMVYSDVSDIIENKNLNLIKKYDNIYREILLMDELASVLRKRRLERGSLDFDVAEACISFGEDGKVLSVEVAERRAAEKMIEEFMIAANETVAKRVFHSKSPFVYRVHEKPEQEKMEDFKVFIKTFGLNLKGSMRDISPQALAGILKKTEGKEYENIVNKVMLRSMNKAFYSPDCKGHFGLGSRYYCHFTAPIRRYPDLIAHRILKELLAGQVTGKRKRALTKKAAKAAELSSIAERKALEIEREAEKRIKAEFMSYHIGEVFSGVISGVTYFGIFVELPNTIEGMVRTDLIDWDYYEYEPERYRLVGEISKRTFTIGDRLNVKVEAVDVLKGYIDFTLYEHKIEEK